MAVIPPFDAGVPADAGQLTQLRAEGLRQSWQSAWQQAQREWRVQSVPGAVAGPAAPHQGSISAPPRPVSAAAGVPEAQRTLTSPTPAAPDDNELAARQLGAGGLAVGPGSGLAGYCGVPGDAIPALLTPRVATASVRPPTSWNAVMAPWPQAAVQVHTAGRRVSVSIRDAELDEQAALDLHAALSRALARDGMQLAELTVNGQPIAPAPAHSS